MVYGAAGVFVVGLEGLDISVEDGQPKYHCVKFTHVEIRRLVNMRAYLFNLPGVALVGAGDIVGQGLWAGEVMVGRGRGDDVALSCDLAGEAGDGAGHCRLVSLSSREDEVYVSFAYVI